MASQLAFEGPVLQDLLDRVRAEIGPDAKIIAANRVRKGGVGGFFAREAYEVLVEPPETETESIGEAVGQDVVAADVVPVAAAPLPAPVAAVVTPAPVARPALSAAEEQARSEARHATILELADAVSEFERNDVIDLVEERNLSTQSREFAQVLDRVSRSIDATTDEASAPPAPAAPVDQQPDRAPGSEIDIRESQREAAAQVAVAPPEAPAPPAPPAPAPSPDLDLNRDDAEEEREIAPIVPPSARSARAAVAAPAEVIDRYETRLQRLGLPARLIPRGVPQHQLKGALVESLTRLPPAPGVPNALGVVIAVVGTASTPVLLARELAGDLGLDPDDVVLATREQLGFGIPAWLQMSDPATAQERGRSWRRRTRPTIVACSMPLDGVRWAREMLDNLEPTMTWAIVDAGAKREDIVHRVDALGGVDVLALDGLDNTVSPASVLELGIPVARLEHEHASPLTWTELFLERMA